MSARRKPTEAPPESGTHRVAAAPPDDRALLEQVLSSYERAVGEEEVIADALRAVSDDLRVLSLMSGDSLVYAKALEMSLRRIQNRVDVIGELYRREREGGSHGC
ncbi:MAG TPA: hypothetical protein VJT73_19825 [Polyangiaceae bacterium]|nr:hypothetical protein [Polyangiaceae bacterium]